MFRCKGNWTVDGVTTREMSSVSGGRGGWDVVFSRDDASIEQDSRIAALTQELAEADELAISLYEAQEQAAVETEKEDA